MTVTPQIADRPLKCRGHMFQGMEEPVIQPGDEYMLMENNNQRDRCCLPCFERLKQALEASQ